MSSTRKITSESGITKTYGPVTVDLVKPHAYKDALDSAQLRMVVTTEYPSARVNTGGFFQTEDFDLEGGKTYESTRIAWIDVPKGKTKEQIEALITDKTVIHTRYSNKLEDVLSEGQMAAIANGLQSREVFEAKCRICDRSGNPLPGVPQYSQNFASATWKDDVDLRTVKNSNPEQAVSAEVRAAVVGAQELV